MMKALLFIQFIQVRTPMGYDNNKNMDFVSCHVHEKSGTLLRESGFKEFPYVVPRYLKSSSNEVYGRSPAMNALA